VAPVRSGPPASRPIGAVPCPDEQGMATSIASRPDPDSSPEDPQPKSSVLPGR
jgi:hypothetical protein